MKIVCGLMVSWLAWTAWAQPPAQPMELFLLIGQSNMAGRGALAPEAQEAHPRIFMLDQAQKWAPARDPLHFDKPKIAGVGLGSQFARCLAAAHTNAVIGLIPCAFGGSSLEQWRPGGALYTNAIARARAAQRQGTLRAILWHQGESDCSPEKRATYAARLATMIAQLRTDLAAAQVPLLVGELGHYNDKYLPFNRLLPQVTNQIPFSALVSAADLGANKDKVHFNTAALNVFGERYFAAYNSLTAPSPQDLVRSFKSP